MPPNGSHSPAESAPVADRFWTPGEQVLWHYRRPGWTPGVPQTAFPTRVIRHDADGLAVHLAGGTRGLGVRRADGTDIRADKNTMFTAPRQQVIDQWWGPGILRLAPAGKPWSVWIFHWAADGSEAEPGAGVRHCWYVNLEAPLRFGPAAVYSTDRVLDVVIGTDGRHRIKDADELEQAVLQGRFSAEQAEQIRSDADAALAAFASGTAWEFDQRWVDWAPDPGWPLPPLPAAWSEFPPAPELATAAASGASELPRRGTHRPTAT